METCLSSKWIVPAARRARTVALAGAVLLTGAMPAALAATATTPTTTTTAPDFGPNVIVLDAAMPSAAVQAALEAVAGETEFGSGRHAVLFKPGAYYVDATVGYYTSVAGLGRHPDDVAINGGLRVEGQIDWGSGTDSALINFWRSIDNLSVTPTGGTTRWAVSQASPMRRVHIRGGLELMPAWWGYSSGGYIANSKIDGQVQSGSQQQWYTRDSQLGSWAGSVWNMVFSGVAGAPALSYPAPPVTTLAATPRSREKPYLYVDDGGAYHVFKPAQRIGAAGTTWDAGGAEAGQSIALDDFLIARPATATASINAALAQGRHVLFTPGVYQLTAAIHVGRANTVLLGLGMATLVPATGQPAITTADLPGIAIAGLIVDAPAGGTPVLVRIGTANASANASASASPAAAGAVLTAAASQQNPILLSDVFFRVGGALAGRADVSLEVNAAHTILDHIWAWRADHGAGAGWQVNRADTGVVVNADHVLALGLFVEHYQKRQVIWNGNHGTTIFYQSELPYDPPSQDAWMDGAINGYASYAVADGVTTHFAIGLGVYSFFNAGQPIVETSAIRAPASSKVRIRNAVAVFLSGSGEISHVVNDQGAAANASSYISFLP